MARQNQILINYHTSGLTNMPSAEDVRFGEIVVRHNDEKPELLVKKNNGEFATFVDTKAVEAAVASAKGGLQDVIDNVEAKVNANTASISALTMHVADTYATSADTVAAINAAKTGATADAKAYTDSAKTEAIAAASAYTVSQINDAKGDLQDAIDNLQNELTSGFTSVRSDLSATTEGLTELINNKVATAYRFQGSCTYAELASKDKVNGYVWNVTDANGNFPAGTNYAWSETDGKWDALGGSIDLSPYYKTADFKAFEGEVNDKFDTIASNIQTANSGTTILEAYIKSTFATSANTVAAINAAKTGATADANAYTDSAKTEAIAAASAYTDSQINIAKEGLQDAIDTVNSIVTTLSETTIPGVKATADSAIQTASANEASNVSITKDGTELKFDFSNLIIDCGDF